MWARSVVDTSYSPMSRAEIQAHLSTLTARLIKALTNEPFNPTPGYELGGALVAAHLFAPETLGRTVQMIDERLLPAAGLEEPEYRKRLAGLLGVLTTGYARALRDRTLDEQEAIRRAALVARDQAEAALRASEARFRHQATHDPLTGLANRALFGERLDQVFATAEPGDRIGVCFLDLDGFKNINDTLGHQMGDRMLAAIAERLDHWIGRNNGPLVARMGGDEFVILVERPSSMDDLIKVADQILRTVGEPLQLGGHEVTVTASIGIVEGAVAEVDGSELMRRADITLNWAKLGGKGRWAVFEATRAETETARSALSAAMPAALDRGEFFLEYQPLVDLRTGVTRGAEALVRWQHPELGVLGPDSFIGLAEETGLIVRLGARVLEHACWQAQHWRQYRDPPFVSVNLAVRQVRDPGLVDRVAGVLDRTGLPAANLQLEITESSVIGNHDNEPLSALHALVDMGVRIAIDDFGTGYSNLAYLRHLPVHEIKIAGTFIEGLRGGAPDSTDEQIIDSLVRLAHILGHTVTVEGVETELQAQRLKAIGCDAGQGWFFGRPGPPHELVARLAHRT